MNIVTSESGYAYFSAMDRDSYDGAPDSHCPIGFGETRANAVKDLQDLYFRDGNDEGIMACDIWLIAHDDKDNA